MISTWVTTSAKVCPTFVCYPLSTEYHTRGNGGRKSLARLSPIRERGSKVTGYSCRAMSHDEARYPDAEKFIPERFLNAEGMLTDDNPADFIFGFGRRRCPGNPEHHNHKVSAHAQASLSLSGHYAADASVWSATVTMLATLDFNLAKDADGNDITFKATFKNGATQYVQSRSRPLVPSYTISDTQTRSLVGSPLARTSTKRCLTLFSPSDPGKPVSASRSLSRSVAGWSHDVLSCLYNPHVQCTSRWYYIHLNLEVLFILSTNRGTAASRISVSQIEVHICVHGLVCRDLRDGVSEIKDCRLGMPRHARHMTSIHIRYVVRDGD